MKHFFTLGVLLVFAFLAVCGYWYLNPHKAPSVLRGNMPELQLPKPKSPMSNFRGPQY